MLQYETNIAGLTNNDQKVLKRIIKEAKISDLEIAKEIGISQQAIFKIRHKLERLEIIKGYMPIIDFKKIGIESMVVISIRLKSCVWEKYTEIGITKIIQDIPEVMNAYRVSESNVSHVLILGFKNTHCKDKYLMNLQSKYSKQMEIVNSYACSADRIIKSSPVSLLNMMLDKKQQSKNNFFPD